MKARTPTLLIFTAILTFCTCEQPEAPPPNGIDSLLSPPNAFAQNDKLARSINLGNALEAPNEGDWGITLEAEWFSIIKAAGFTGIRLPIRWSAHAELDSPYALHADFRNRVDWAIDQALDNELAVVFNVHHYEEMFTDPIGEKSRLMGIWRNIAEHYKDMPDDVIFELFNEPHDQFTSDLWNQYLAEGIALIREIDPYRTLMIGTAGWGGLSAMSDLVLPADSNLIFTIHYYEPFHFTHQGAEWVNNADEWLGTTWTGTTAQRIDVELHFQQVLQWAETNKRPVYVGEFGAYRQADMNSRFKWTEHVVQVCEARNFAWGYWEFCAGFGAYDLSLGRWNALLHALIQD